MLVPGVIGVYRHAGVAHHGLRPGGGHHQIAGPVRQGIAHVPQVTGLVHILYLGVGQSGDAVGAPVDDPAALVDETFLIELTEGLPHCLGAALIHGEPGPIPVAGGAHFFLLGHNAVAVHGLPVPDPLQEFLPAQVIAGQALLHPELLLHLDLGGDAGVVGARDPQGGISLHPLKANEDVLQGAVHGVAHVELAGDVGRRHDDGIGLLFGIPDAGEALVFLPLLINSAFHLMGVVDLGQFFSHSGFSSITLQHSGSLAPEADFFSGFWGIVSPQNSWIGSWVCWPMKALKDIASPVVKPALSRMIPWLMSKKMTYQFWSDTTAKACS